MSKHTQLPKHVGIIMDGNRRWARAKGLPSIAGHERGYHQALKVAEHAFMRGITYLTLYAFSSENWDRTKAEVGYLMSLLHRMIAEQTEKLHKKGIRLMFIGSRSKLNTKLLKAIDNAHRRTQANTKGTLLIALNYGGRTEIVDAARALIKAKYSFRKVTEQLLGEHLYAKAIPDPDLIIRTSGEQRLSGFLLWQSAYSELYFTSKYWPSFGPKDFDEALDDYAQRMRRFGK